MPEKRLILFHSLFPVFPSKDEPKHQVLWVHLKVRCRISSTFIVSFAYGIQVIFCSDLLGASKDSEYDHNENSPYVFRMSSTTFFCAQCLAFSITSLIPTIQERIFISNQVTFHQLQSFGIFRIIILEKIFSGYHIIAPEFGSLSVIFLKPGLSLIRINVVLEWISLNSRT